MSSRLRNGTGSRISFFAFQDIIASVTGVLILVTLILASHLDKLSSVEAEEVPEQLEQRLATILEMQARLEMESRTLAESLAIAQSQPDAGKIRDDIALLNTRIDAERERLDSAKAQTERQRLASRQRDTTLGLTGLRDDVDKTRADALAITGKDRVARLEKEKLESEVNRAESGLLTIKARQGNLWLIPDEKPGTKKPILAVVSGDGVTLERFDKPDSRRTLNASGSFSEFRRFLSEHNPRTQYFVFYIRPSGISLFNQLSEQAKDNQFEIGFDALDEGTKIHFTKPPALDELPGSGEPSSEGKPPSTPNPNVSADSPPTPPTIKTSQSEPPKTKPESVPQTTSPPADKLSWWQRILRAIGLN